MKTLLIVLILIHGMIHLLGFVKAFNIARVSQLTKHISKVYGILWLISTFLFTLTAILIILNKEIWWMPAILSLCLSQYLILRSWQDAKFGTLANVLILTGAVIYFTWYS